jgi:hypothetical protein
MEMVDGALSIMCSAVKQVKRSIEELEEESDVSEYFTIDELQAKVDAIPEDIRSSIEDTYVQPTGSGRGHRGKGLGKGGNPRRRELEYILTKMDKLLEEDVEETKRLTEKFEEEYPPKRLGKGSGKRRRRAKALKSYIIQNWKQSPSAEVQEEKIVIKPQKPYPVVEEKEEFEEEEIIVIEEEEKVATEAPPKKKPTTLTEEEAGRLLEKYRNDPGSVDLTQYTLKAMKYPERFPNRTELRALKLKQKEAKIRKEKEEKARKKEEARQRKEEEKKEVQRQRLQNNIEKLAEKVEMTRLKYFELKKRKEELEKQLAEL